MSRLRKILISTLVGTAVVGGMTGLGIDLVTSVVVAAFVTVVFAIMVLTGYPNDRGPEHYGDDDSYINTRSSHGPSD